MYGWTLLLMHQTVMDSTVKHDMDTMGTINLIIIYHFGDMTDGKNLSLLMFGPTRSDCKGISPIV